MFEKAECPKCNKINYIYLGNQEDMTSSVGESPVCMCWNCENKFLWTDIDQFDDDDKYYMFGWDSKLTKEENLEQMDYEPGTKDP